jgi:hypothetical protein
MFLTAAQQLPEIFQATLNVLTMGICVTLIRPSQPTVHQPDLAIHLLNGLIKALWQLAL